MGNCVCIHTIEDNNLNKQRVKGVKRDKEKSWNSTSENVVQKQSVEEKKNDLDHEVPHSTTVRQPVVTTLLKDDNALAKPPESSNLKHFTYLELKLATLNFSEKHCIGEGGFGRVYRGWAFDGEDCVPVAIKQLNPKGFQGYPEWLTEVVLLSRLCHPNIVRLVGHCSEKQEYYLVYEYMSKGSLDNYLFCGDSELLGWAKRINIALGVAQALAFLHSQDPPVIYRDIKSSNVLLNSEFGAKLSDFGLAKDGPTGLLTHVSTRVYGTYGYVAPEYYQTDHCLAESHRRPDMNDVVKVLKMLDEGPAIGRQQKNASQG
ncbi:probable serine/threonine-protein kinase PBL1 isoform X2 [Aristolochia californica]|uniref:probable serine/threonine-protein kinase PBL1 isoform X2 n=1 Tax=Aristolochia californica TaxID=171875 RepID=UPI0035DC3B2F